MSSTSAKRALCAHFAGVARALAHGHRLELLEHVAQGERSVEDLAQRVGLSIGNASQHLQHLRRAGLVTARRDGKYILYGLSDDQVVTVVSALRRVAERNLADVARVLSGYFHERDSFEPVSREELLERQRDGLVTVLDVRPADEFRAGHVPGAVNVPLPELERRLAEIPQDREVVAYCRGPYCVLSFEAVAKLRARGFRIRRLEEGFPEWRAAGLPVQTLPKPAAATAAPSFRS